MSNTNEEIRKPEVRKRPKARVGDVAHAIVRAGLSAVPIVGGPAEVLFSEVIAPPLAKRRNEWLESIATTLEELERKVDDFRIENLAQNETFISTVLHATQVALRSHQREKIEALRNAVLNAALPRAPDEDMQLIFLSFIDAFTPWHLRILKFFDDPTEWGQKHNVKYGTYYMGGQSAILEDAFPELKGRRSFYDQIVRDLFNRGLMNIETLHIAMSKQGMFASRTTTMGKLFIAFITSSAL